MIIAELFEMWWGIGQNFGPGVPKKMCDQS